MKIIIRNRHLSIFQMICSGAFLFVVMSCGGSGSPGSSCVCTLDEDCPEEHWCDGCHCVAKCKGPWDCPPHTPNCDTSTGRCLGPCEGPEDCKDPDFPNCSASGACEGPCSSHLDCTHPERPNCSMDPGAEDHGVCRPRCNDNDDCEGDLYPNCHVPTGRCGPGCSGDGDCPDDSWKCDTDTGVCVMKECSHDYDCNPPDTVCENWFCVQGCTEHSDCPEDERCNLDTPGKMYHCEPRDCFSDDDCNPPNTVCDTDGLADPDGGGYCLPGCGSYLDCLADGYECNPSTGRCEPLDYGDIGENCDGGCSSNFCLTGMGNVCTAFCCRQADCPAGWGCRRYPDGTGEGRKVSVCLPLESSQGDRSPGETCSAPEECRSNICFGNKCRETCCTNSDCGEPLFPGTDCRVYQETNVCINAPPPEESAPVGSLGCATTGSPNDCRSDMCFIYFIPDTECTSDADCPQDRPTCWDYPGAGVDGVNDCVMDMCVGHCCNSDDCPDYNGNTFFCGKWLYPSGDFNVCLLHEGSAALAEGEPCTQNSECRSNFCSDSGTCRRRCCKHADCTHPERPRCALEEHTVHSATRWLNVCVP